MKISLENLLFERTVNPVIIIDEDGMIIDINGAGLTFLECERSDLSENNISNYTTAILFRDNDKKNVLWKEGGVLDADFHIKGKVKSLSINAMPVTIEGKNRLVCIGNDITKLKESLVRLRHSEEISRIISENASDYIAILDIEGRYQYLSPSHARLGWDTDSLVGTSGLERLHPLDKVRLAPLLFKYRNMILAGNTKIFEKKVTEILDFRAQDSEGVWRAFEAHADLTRDPASGSPCIVIIYREVPSKRAIENHLAIVTRCFLSFGTNPVENIEKVMESVQLITGADSVLYNIIDGPDIITVSGCSLPHDFQQRDRKEGHICWDIVENREESPVVLNDLDQSNYAKTDINVKKYNLKTYMGAVIKVKGRHAGTLCVVSTVNKKFDQDTVKFFSILSRVLEIEIERDRAFKELEEAQGLQKAILNNIPDIAWLKDTEGRFIAINQALAQAFEKSPEEILGKTDFDFFERTMAAKYVEDDNRIIREKKRMLFEEMIEFSKGQRKWIETIKTPIFNKKGEVMGTAGIARDISDRKRSEEDKEKMLFELQRFKELVIGRENKMIDLKKTINSLCREMNRPEPYNLTFLEE